MGKIIGKIFLFFLAISLISYSLPLILIVLVLLVIYKIYEIMYFKSNDFQNIKNRVKDYISNCNELNNHIEDLKNTYVNSGENRVDYGNAELIDSSNFNYKRPELKKNVNASNIHHCSKSVVSNAKLQPFKYLCKYFDFNPDEKTLESVENLLNNYSAAENGKKILIEEKNEILNGINIPFLIKKFSLKKFEKNLGFKEIDLSDTYFPKFVFQYVSPAGNSSLSTEIILDINNLEKLITYLADQIKFKNSVQGQRRLMTQKLREEIKKRDNFTCQHCGVSLMSEPHLLLEIDHIVPVSKGGMTEESNLQTLCWKCNRSKSNKLI